MHNPKSALIGVVMDSDRVVAWVAISSKHCLPSTGIREYMYGVMETMFKLHPLFSTSRCTWQEAEEMDEEKWKDSCYPTIYVW